MLVWCVRYSPIELRLVPGKIDSHQHSLHCTSHICISISLIIIIVSIILKSNCGHSIFIHILQNVVYSIYMIGKPNLFIIMSTFEETITHLITPVHVFFYCLYLVLKWGKWLLYMVFMNKKVIKKRIPLLFRVHFL